MLTSCGGGGKRTTIHVNQQQEADLKAAKEAKILEEKNNIERQNIEQLVSQARLENPETTALEQLLALSNNPNIPLQSQGLAAFKYAELLFEFERADAFAISQQTIKQWSKHPYLPQFYNQLAYQWSLLENNEKAMTALTQALYQSQIDPYTLTENTEIANTLLESVSQLTQLDWMLAVSRHHVENRDYWLRQAAAIASLDYILELRRSDHALTPEQVNFYRYFARQRLMIGDYRTVRLTAKILENDMPETEAYETVKSWANSEGRLVIIGILLPLTGKYASYGEQVLNGIRLAINRPEFEDSIVLHIQDTEGDAKLCIQGYQQLLNQGAEWIIGPLLSSNTQALLPFLQEDIPVIALSNRVQLAAESPSLFIHSLAKVVQADFMARHAIQEGQEHIVILHGYTNSAFEEAAAFAQTFMDAGGEILDIVELEKGISDNRPDLIAMRYRTDDEELLASLDEDLNLFSPELNMDIKMPLAFDAMYIVEQGKKVAVLAGQMAYSDIRGMQLYGSYRWHDGHLLDDQGRYLSGAQFAAPLTSTEQPNQAVADIKSQYRLIWDNDNMSPLFALAYDTAMNIATLGSRLGLKGADAIDALMTTVEFPAISGNYYYNQHGISQKTFAVQRIRNGRIE